MYITNCFGFTTKSVILFSKNMKYIVLFLAIVFVTYTNVQAQPQYFSYKDLKLNGLLFISIKEDILKTLGEPSKIYEPNYDCGFLSAAEQSQKFYSLQYPDLIFTGNNKSKYQLEELSFANKKYKITYKGTRISSTTTKAEFEQLFQVKIKGDEISLTTKGADDIYIFRFRKNRLSVFKYWSPC